MLNKTKLLLGITTDEKDDLLTLLIESAMEEAIAYTHNDCVLDLETTILKMVVYNYNRLGSEGVDGEGYSGVSFTYSADYPESILRALKSKRKVIFI